MEFGLTEYQSRVYLALLDLGKASASQIPPISRVPRTRIYATMSQLHEKGLVEIVPETPLKYKAVPFSRHLRKVSEEYRQKASEIEANMDALSKEFSIRAGGEPEERGRVGGAAKEGPGHLPGRHVARHQRRGEHGVVGVFVAQLVEERAREAAEDVRLRAEGDNRRRDEAEPGKDTQGVRLAPRGKGKGGRDNQIRFPVR